MTELNEVVIVSAVRTPIASFRSSFSHLSLKELGTITASKAIETAGISPGLIDETIGGCVLTAGHGQNISRQISIGAGIPSSSPAMTINKVCSSGLKAAILAVEAIKLSDRATVLAMGMESMSTAPFYLSRGDTPYGGLKMIDSILKDGLTDGTLDEHMGWCAEKTAKDCGISREEQDEYAIDSYKRAQLAWKSGIFRSEIIPVTVRPKRGAEFVVSEDEEFKRLNEEKMKKLSPAFLQEGNGTITAANSSSLNDGCAALVLMSLQLAKKLNLQPLAKIVAYSESATDPIDFTMAPSFAVPKLLERAGISIETIDLWEINEAFSVTALANMKQLNLPHSKVNIHGGAVALGHPIGMSGARILVHLCHCLSKGQRGIAAICNGGGEATAMLIEKL